MATRSSGILLAKDLLRLFTLNNSASFDIRDWMRKALFVPESKRVNVLLKELRMGRNHMAIAVDEYGSVAGLVTIEDVIEQIIGEIDDEYDVEDGEEHPPRGRAPVRRAGRHAHRRVQRVLRRAVSGCGIRHHRGPGHAAFRAPAATR